MTSWSGKSRGSISGYKIFVWIIENLGLKAAYFLLRFVSFYYLLFSPKSFSQLFYYFNKRLGNGWLKSVLNIYTNYYIFGQTLIDRAVIMAGYTENFTYEFDGKENLEALVHNGTGGILISAHIGNWEVAGHQLENSFIKVNVVMFEDEHEKIKKYLNGVKKDKKFNIIVVNNSNLEHIYKINEALQNKELVCMHGDRFTNGGKTQVCNFLGAEAEFPIGPFMLANQLGAPISFVYAMKKSSRHYRFSATTPLQSNAVNGKQEKINEAVKMLHLYINNLEKMVSEYPLQWFNYYRFWK